MAKKPTYAVSGPGKFAKPKVSEAGGGQYGERAQLQSLESGAPTQQPAPRPTPISVTPAFAPGNPNIPLTEGVDAGPGRGSEALTEPVNSLDDTSILVRAMYLANPTPQNRRLLEMFQMEDN
jgi:hypothetical protein